MKGNAMIARLALGLFAVLLSTLSSHAQSVEDFYRGKSIQLLIAQSAGGNYDLNARLLARHISKHIPGNPTIVPQNFVGAAGLRLANFLFKVAPRDGTTIGMVSRGTAMEPLLGNSAAQYDSRHYTWLGSVSDETSLCVTWHTSKIKTFDDMLSIPFVVGGQGPASDNDMFAYMLHNVFGAKVRVVPGYPGGNEINLAMERGEVDGRCGWSWGAVKTTRADWLASKKINLVLQNALERASDLPKTVPLIMDRARNDRERQILRLIFSRQQMAWPFAAPPDLPADRAAALRTAFDATMKDPDYVAEAHKRKVEVNPMSGLAIAQLVSELYAAPPDILAATRAAISGGSK
jgi:tripartite-type tricarboxylate transporter receptor subunit TctC